MNIICKLFGHSWKLKWRHNSTSHKSMKCSRCGKTLLIKGRFTKDSDNG